jgi:hypothetical protein
MSFNPDVTVAVVVPVAVDPAGVGVGRFDVGAGDPDVGVAVPAVVTGVPGPVGVLAGWRWNALNWAGWWADADYNLGLRDTCGEKKCAGNRGEYFFHWSLSPYMLLT